MRAWEARALPLGDTRARPNASTMLVKNARDLSYASTQNAKPVLAEWRPAAFWADGIDAAQLPCEFRWTASLPLSSPAIPSGRRLTAQQSRDSQWTALHRPAALHPPSGCCRHYPAALRLPADVGLIVAGCTRGASIRATGALRLDAAPPNSALPAARQMTRCVPLGVWPWQYIAVVYSPRGLGQEKGHFAAIYRRYVFK